MYQVGKITNTHGIKGEVKVYNLSDFNRFSVNNELYVVLNNERINLKVKAVREAKNQLIIKFANFNDINQVLQFKGLFLYSDQILDSEIEEDDYHYQDLIGKNILNEDGVILGVVTNLIEVPQGHILEVLVNNKKRLIPFRKEFIGNINSNGIIVYPIEGLL